MIIRHHQPTIVKKNTINQVEEMFNLNQFLSYANVKTKQMFELG